MKLKGKIMSILSMATVLYLLPVCNVVNHKELSVDPPFEDMDVVFRDYEINSSQDNFIEVANGTSIEIPKDAFVDANNVPIKGDVKINYREFHDAAQILASGITMTYDSGGVRMNLQSAGMFEIRGFKDGKPVFIANGKDVKVNMASFAEGDGYNFYRLDESQSNWQYQGIVAANVNEKKKSRLERVAPIPGVPVKPEIFRNEQVKFDFTIDYTLYPELREFHGIVWQSVGKNASSDLLKRKWVFNQNWSNILLKRTDQSSVYQMKLSNSYNKFTTLVKPVFKGKNYKKAMAIFEKNKVNYDNAVAARIEEETRMEKEADLIRSFAISNFGIYNWDRQLKQGDLIALNANFKFDQNVDLDMSKVTVFLITGQGRSVIKYPQYAWSKFAFSPKVENKLIAVLPGNKIAYFSSADFEKIDIPRLKSRSNNNYTFHLKNSDQSFASVDNLSALIQSI
ncbi:MAG: hypothetical protein JKY33_04650 [Bacteroidia bacterium]|nr:hypothetical protein [Bacteroidia bacterium]